MHIDGVLPYIVREIAHICTLLPGSVSKVGKLNNYRTAVNAALDLLWKRNIIIKQDNAQTNTAAASLHNESNFWRIRRFVGDLSYRKQAKKFNSIWTELFPNFERPGGGGGAKWPSGSRLPHIRIKVDDVKNCFHFMTSKIVFIL